MTIALDRPGATAADREQRADLVARAAKLLPRIADNAERTDRERRVVEENIEALAGAGLLSVLQPARYGGLQTDMRTCLEVSREIARACGSTAWSATLLNVCSWYVGLFPGQAQNDVWAEDPTTRVAGVLAPTGTAVQADGGFVVTGRWSPASGSAHARWAIVGVLRGSGADAEPGMVLIPMAELTVEDTWFVTGMRGTASNTLVAEGVFVPGHRYLSSPEAVEGRYPTPHTEEAVYRSAFVPVSALVLAGPQLGLAQAALDLVVAKAPRRTMTYTFYDSQAVAPTSQLAIAQAASLIDSAQLHAYRAAAEIDEAAANGGYPDYDARARMRMDTGVATVNAREAIRILVSVHGAGSFAEANPLQRIWRDSETGSRHAIINPEVSTDLYGKSLLGIRGTVTHLI
ncbi:acyl-CoA dehydrogenase family protein [Catenulispora sp. NF23]|uniref:Acyl-CoA dehydrogenase family protein n=1 Tax=Catenulispora pinistramenti TaxID=2705254 RepID=A0ABS5KPE7_9ACTN|nr:acyl-CoA dehydrogenase family protein [Catenulispora pinistramenti]MBS2533453.1 acyl-CoA dehydrogenase family protein [Catenulispora pinistramenti]MBS2547933.1 acyl-CoA dehydrogenase family protein [Catenulispora pinistramenti]